MAESGDPGTADRRSGIGAELRTAKGDTPMVWAAPLSLLSLYIDYI